MPNEVVELPEGWEVASLAPAALSHRPYLRPTNDSWRVDETYVKVKEKDRYLYQAVNSEGNTLDFLPAAKRDVLFSHSLFP